jgi:hypothetical protein
MFALGFGQTAFAADNGMGTGENGYGYYHESNNGAPRRAGALRTTVTASITRAMLALLDGAMSRMVTGITMRATALPP